MLVVDHIEGVLLAVAVVGGGELELVERDLLIGGDSHEDVVTGRDLELVVTVLVGDGCLIGSIEMGALIKS